MNTALEKGKKLLGKATKFVKSNKKIIIIIAIVVILMIACMMIYQKYFAESVYEQLQREIEIEQKEKEKEKTVTDVATSGVQGMAESVDLRETNGVSGLISPYDSSTYADASANASPVYLAVGGAGSTPPSGDKTIILFYAPWCGHCKKFREGPNSMWEQLKKRNENKIKFNEINGDEHPELATKYHITQYPTIIKISGDKKEVFNEERSLRALENFIHA